MKNTEKAPKNFKNVRNREIKDKKDKKQKNYEHCFSASDLEKELKLILEKQRELGHNYNDDFIKQIIELAFFQRPLKDFSHLVGTCTFFEDEKRACKNSYSAIEFVTLTKVINELKSLEKESGEPSYPLKSSKKIIDHILDKGSISYKKSREYINLDPSIGFKSLKGDKKIQKI